MSSEIRDYKLVVFDADGTLVEPKSGDTFRKTADDWQWLPSRLEKIKSLIAKGVKVAIATNQGGVAFGYMRAQDILAELSRMCKEADIAGSCLYVCYTHPKASLEQYRADDDRRKPGPRMLQEAMNDLEVDTHETLYVGDRNEDKLAAEAAGVSFEWAWNYFQEGPIIV